jgi:hypothetical protein
VLLSLQNSSGSFSYQASFPGDNVLATVQAIPAAAGVTLTRVRRVATSAAPGATATTPPTTLPVAGDDTLPAAAGLVLVGLLMFVAGLGIKHNRQVDNF